MFNAVMLKRLNNILVPVDFSENTEVAISKALAFCQDDEECTIHLFNVQRIAGKGLSYLISNALYGYTQNQVNSDMRNSKNRLEYIKEGIESKRKNIKVLCWVSFRDSVQENIIKKARQLSPDLIVIGKRSRHTIFPFLNTVVPGRIAAVTGVPVLTAMPGSLHQEIKTVVIPISDQFSVSKLEIIRALRHKSRLHFRLVAFEKDRPKQEDSRHLLLQLFRDFKSHFISPINYEILEGSNKAQTLLKYCDRIGADILIVHKEAGTLVRNRTRSHISDLLPATSKMQILSI